MISFKKIEELILSDKYNSIIFEKGERRDVYLVGGYIRDILRGVFSRDRDYIVTSNLESFVQEMQEKIGGTIVKFKKGNMVRIATKTGFTFDFSNPIGILSEDLSKRDFTINAVAWSPHDGIIDLYDGLDDIQKRRICVIRKENFISDPLRMLRAYRFASELNGFVEKGTRKLIKVLKNNIKEISSERITLEIFCLLNQDQSSKYLKMALYDGLLEKVLFFTSKVLERNIKEISLFERLIFYEFPHTIKVELKEIFSQNLTYKGLLCFALLMKNSFKRKTISHNIKPSKKISKRIDLIILYLKEKLTKGKLFDLYLEAEDATIDILILKNRIDFIKDYKRFKRIWNQGIISSEEVIHYSGIVSGKALGDIIREIKRSQYEGRVKNKNSAIRLIKIIRNG